MEMRKIAFACFIGGALYVLAALYFAPEYCWLALFAGLAGGYLSYEFREVLRAIPAAWRQTNKKSIEFAEKQWNFAKKYMQGYVSGVREYFKEQHPFAYSSIVVGMVPTVCFLVALNRGRATLMVDGSPVPIVDRILLSAMCFFLTSSVSAGIITLLAYLGARVREKVY